jgi:hypothetical protein
MNKYLKIVITSKGQKQFFKGDGIWFGRITKSKFDDMLANGCRIWEQVNHAADNIIQFSKP